MAGFVKLDYPIKPGGTLISLYRAYQLSKSLKHFFVGIGIFIAVLAIINDGYGSQLIAVLASLSAVALAALAENFLTKFERF